ncbi:MAG: ATP diphosphatase, partial [Cellvibrionaceae bacterium]
DDSLNDLLTVMARLREPNTGCPWDLAQSYQTIASSTIEEAYEVVDAIDRQDYPQLKDELGDLLFQVIFYSQLAKEEGRFDFYEVAAGASAKLLRRHPHVFPSGKLDSRIDPDDRNLDRREESIKVSWERIKQEERTRKGYRGLLDDIPKALPAVMRSVKLQKRAASVGFDWPSAEGVYDKIQEELGELKVASDSNDQTDIEEELGDLLFTVVNLARHLKVGPEKALRRANTKFEERLQYLEQQAISQGESLSKQPTDILEKWWKQAKGRERKSESVTKKM